MMMMATVLALVSSPAPPPALSALIAEARKVARYAGEEIWPGFSRAPFAVDLVGERHEYLYCAPGPARGFVALGRDARTGCSLKRRPRHYRRSMQATFVNMDGAPRVVIGMPGHTDGNPAAWIATLLHEHFHQMQMHAPAYEKDIRALGLSGGDQSGTWMLHHGFPYQRKDVAAGFAKTAAALARALKAENKPAFLPLVRAWRKTRRQAFARLGEDSRRYAEFQLWQEGVARYSEIALAEAAAGQFACRAERAPCPDYSALALNLRVQVMRHLEHLDMATNGRVSFYALGAGEALLLDRLNPHWREHYFDAGLSMAPLVYSDAAHPAATGNARARFSPSETDGQRGHGRP